MAVFAVRVDPHPNGEAYHCSFHEEPTIGYKLPGSTLYFDILAGNKMKSFSLGALSDELVRPAAQARSCRMLPRTVLP